MTAARAPFAEAAAFFDLFVRSDWASCHVRADGIELFVARDPGHANPLLGAIADDDADAGAAAVPVDETPLTAPHVATLVELAAVGTRVAAGERYGAIDLLGERSDLIATRGGIVRRHVGRIGALVEHDQPLVTIG